ncbi:sigma-70 family RNA polymerase sigma factor [Nonomuraea sp. CA-143628]|uniref:sigma-70 family RNA polymerase sigma factor n=1 Tax=Nonomuraea sp. CA-143628 TaxID=3239997 RepID=UPI003D91B400
MIEECFAIHRPMVRAYLRHLIPAQDVDDVTQAVFADVWRCRLGYDPARSLESWLLTITHRRAVDYLRARRLATVPLESVAEPPGRDGRDDGEDLANRDLIGRALAELPEAQREAIRLAYWEDLSQREIAERLDVPLGTVKARTARGLHRLHALLEAA